MNKQRCIWCTAHPLYIKYHDEEWGVPIYDDRLLFEFLILEGMQAGLSWFTILKKREAFRLAFLNFDAEKIAKFNSQKINLLLNNPGIIRNKLKINATIENAKSVLNLKKEWESFAMYIWQFVNGTPILNHWDDHKLVPVRTSISDTMAKDLKKRGFKFIGSTICYAFMQAVGMVNDHNIYCFRHKALTQKSKIISNPI